MGSLKKTLIAGDARNKEIYKGLRGKETELSMPGSKVKVFVIPTNEELAIARETLELVRK